MPSNEKTTKEIEVPLESSEWYQALIEECKATIVESEFNSRWSLVEGYYKLGKRILEETDNFERSKIYGQKMTQRVAVSLNKSQRTIEQAIQFAKKYPDLDKFPEGKNISWRKIVNKYLPAHKEGSEIECNHPESEIKEISFLKCKGCGKNLESYSRYLVKNKIIKDVKNWAERNNFPEFPLEFNEEGIPFLFIPAGKKDWEDYLKKNSLPELWKVWKRIEDKRT